MIFFLIGRIETTELRAFRADKAAAIESYSSREIPLAGKLRIVYLSEWKRSHSQVSHQAPLHLCCLSVQQGAIGGHRRVPGSSPAVESSIHREVRIKKILRVVSHKCLKRFVEFLILLPSGERERSGENGS